MPGIIRGSSGAQTYEDLGGEFAKQIAPELMSSLKSSLTTPDGLALFGGLGAVTGVGSSLISGVTDMFSQPTQQSAPTNNIQNSNQNYRQFQSLQYKQAGIGEWIYNSTVGEDFLPKLTKATVPKLVGELKSSLFSKDGLTTMLGAGGIMGGASSLMQGILSPSQPQSSDQSYRKFSL